MEIVLTLIALGVWFVLTQILTGLMSTVINLPFTALNFKGSIIDFIVSMISSFIVLYLGIYAFPLIGIREGLIIIPIVMLISYTISLRSSGSSDGRDTTAIRNGAWLGVIVGTILYIINQ